MALPLIIILSFVASPIVAQLPTNTPSLTPPSGNSIQIKAKAWDGIFFYRCVHGDWHPDSAFANLVDNSNSSSLVGNYSFVFHPSYPQYVGTWTLLNSLEDAAESGSPMSRVSGKEIASFSASPSFLHEFLAEATAHEFIGAASLISYISRMNTNGGVPPKTAFCTDNAVIKIPFEADFNLWRQDVLPPNVPQQLRLNSHQRLVQSFFTEGFVEYQFDGTKWVQENVLARMYNLPGGYQVGYYYLKSQPDNQGGTHCWNVSNPNGFEITGKNACNPVSVTSSSLPWALMVVTSSKGNASVLGPYSYVQMVSTNGGIPPTKAMLLAEKNWRSSFSAIFWLYSSV